MVSSTHTGYLTTACNWCTRRSNTFWWPPQALNSWAQTYPETSIKILKYEKWILPFCCQWSSDLKILFMWHLAPNSLCYIFVMLSNEKMFLILYNYFVFFKLFMLCMLTPSPPSLSWSSSYPYPANFMFFLFPNQREWGGRERAG